MEQDNKTTTLSPLSNARQEQQAESARQLGETRMSNVESSMQRNYTQQEWLRQYTKLNKTLKEHTDNLQRLNKQMAANSSEVEELLRYETFESIQEVFQQMRLLQKMNEENRQAQQRMGGELDTAIRIEEEERRKMALRIKEAEESERHMRAVGEKMEVVYHIQGERNVLNIDIQAMRNFADTLTQRKEALEQTIKEQTEEKDNTQAEMVRLNAVMHSMEPHRIILVQGRHLLLKLNAMDSTKEELALMDTELRESTQKLMEANRTRESIVSDCQHAEADIRTLNAQLQGHLSSIAGTDSYALQEMALRQTTLQQVLLCAQTHWGHIKDGYQEIEETFFAIISIKNRIGDVSHSLLTPSELCEQETLRNIMESHLDKLKEKQERLVREWSIYAHLDSSFVECSPSTNMEARIETIKQLAANAIRNAEDARQKLDNYNFHMSQINALTEELTKKEQEKSKLTKRLSEVSTTCQMMTKHMEYLNKCRAGTQARFAALYEEMNQVISLSGWMQEWQSGSESLKARIADMVNQWEVTKEETKRLQARLAMMDSTLSHNKEEEAFVDSCIQHLQKALDRRISMLQKGEKDMERALDNYDGRDFYEASFQRLTSAYEAVRRHIDVLLKAATELANTRGKEETTQAMGKHTEEQLSLQHFNLDVWISRYNSSHSPVQYKELEATFSNDKDWNVVRQRIRQAQTELDVEREVVKYLNGEIAGMQATMSHTATDINGLSLDALQKQMEQLRQQYREAAVLVAESSLTLRRSEHLRERLQQGGGAAHTSPER